MADDENSKNIFSKVIPGILIALIAGGSSPWWWDKIFPSDGGVPIEVSPSPSVQSSLLGKTVWMHISAESQKTEADYLLKKFNKNGATVYQATNLVKEGKVSPENQNKAGEKVFSENGKILVKFFYNEDRNAATEIEKLIEKNNTILSDNTQASTRNSQGIIEVWYPWSQQ